MGGGQLGAGLPLPDGARLCAQCGRRGPAVRPAVRQLPRGQRRWQWPSGSGGLEPPPIAFTDSERADARSLAALYQVISQGVEGTSMTDYSSLPEKPLGAGLFYQHLVV